MAASLAPPHRASSLEAPLGGPPGGTAPETRDRFLAFAFAAADLLIEATPDGIITFAAGAFRPRFGFEAARFLTRHASTLIAPLDQTAFAMALASAALRGRIAPLLLRLSDPRQTQACLSAIMMPGTPPRLCLTLGPAPAAAPEMSPGEPVMASDSRALSRAASLRVRGGAADAPSGELGLVELKGWRDVKEAMSSADQQALRSDIAEVFSAAGPGALASEMAEGRFGVLAASTLDLRVVVERLQSLIRDSPACRHAHIESTGVSLDPAGLAPAQAARALRFALSRFAEGGMEAATAAGGAEGLVGIIARAELRARAVRQAIAGRRFRLLFQPIVALADRAVHHYEALLRPIATPGSPVQTPQEFVTFAEAVGLAEALDIAVLEQACRVLARGDGPQVAVNVSGLSMQSRSFREHVMEVLANPAFAARLMFELTETAEIEDVPAAALSMARFREAGVALCLDDFGAGASAFRYLRDFGVDFVKIDGGYVHAAPRSPRERGFVVSMIDLARSVGARTVAEMIETEQQAQQMRALGVELGQGWLFGRPGALPGAVARSDTLA